MPAQDFKREEETVASLSPGTPQDKIILHMLSFYFTWTIALS